MPTDALEFPPEFVWGVASSSYQIEGAVAEDGRAPSVWDDFSHTPGKIKTGDTGDVACDSYHRSAEDADLIAGLGAGAYRLSIAWPRVIPDGTGAINEPGLAYYDRVVDELLERGVDPWITLYHWDLPSALHARGGWQNRDIVEWFADYTRAVVDRLSDRVSHWMTLNEPQIFLGYGYGSGTHAPGLQLSQRDLLLATHHALLAHGRACQVIREHAKKPPTIGWAPVGAVACPATDDPADVEAARHDTFTIGHGGAGGNTWYADPVVLGHYPEDGLALYGDDAPKARAGDMDLICQPLDFYGVNIYSGGMTRAGRNGEDKAHWWAEPGGPVTCFGWPVRPQALYWGCRFIQERYKLPVYVTENGLASMDWVHADGHVHDTGRIDFLARYLSEVRRAIGDGVDVRGYFQWSILDNFEWAEGFRMRFGLVYVDYRTLERLPKDSYRWYAEAIRTHGRSIPEVPAAVR